MKPKYKYNDIKIYMLQNFFVAISNNGERLKDGFVVGKDSGIKWTVCLRMKFSPTIVTERFSSEITRQIGPRNVYGQIVWKAIV